MADEEPAGLFPLPDESAGIADFILKLRAVKLWAGDPSLEVLSRRTGEAKSTLFDSFNVQRRRLPSLRVVRAVVRACGADPFQVKQWELAWREVRERTDVTVPCDPERQGSSAGSLVSPGEWIPRQLPPDISGFVGRAAALDALAGRPNQAPATIVTGTAGVGKTALVVRWAHQVADQYPDGQLYLDLHGHAGGPAVTPTEALCLLLQSLGVPAGRIPVDLQLQMGMYRSILADRRVLVVLDNVMDVAHVRPLLPSGPYCHALITSRDALTGLIVREGVARIMLDVLTAAESVELLAAHLSPGRVGAEPAATTEIAGLCAYLPLALRITAANLAARPGQTIAGAVEELTNSDLLGRLRAVGDPESAVAAAFDLSYHSLPPDTQKLFRLLGLVPGPEVDRPATASLLGRDPDDLVPELDELVAAHLLAESAPGRYRSHDLLALYARRHAAAEPAGVRDVVLHRLLSWYLLTTEAATRLIVPTYTITDRSELNLTGTTPNFSGVDDARAWLCVELPNLTKAVTFAADNGLTSFAWHLAHALLGFLHTRGSAAEELAIAEIALRAAEVADHPHARALCHMTLGGAAVTLRDLRMAVEQYESAREQYARIQNTRGVTAAENNLGAASLCSGDIDRALKYFVDTIEDDPALDIDGLPLATLCNRATCHRTRGAYAEALRLNLDGVAQAERSGAPQMRLMATLGLGMTHLLRGDPESAETLLLDAYSTAVQVGSDIGAYDALAGLVLVLTRTGRHQEAFTWIAPLGELLDRGVSSNSGDDWAHAAILEAHLDAGLLDEGIALGTPALKQYEKAGYRLTAMRVRLALGRLHAARGNTETAHQHWEYALRYTIEQGLPERAHIDTLLSSSPGRPDPGVTKVQRG